jgi:hypothetical protein
MSDYTREFKALSKDIQAIIESMSPNCKTKKLKHAHCDGAVCDKKHHQILYQDKNIRIMDVSLDANEDEIFHRHERCAFMYVDKPAKIEYYLIDRPRQFAWASDDLKPRFNVIPSEEMHKVKNVDVRPFRAFRIEINLDIATLENFKSLSEKILTLVKSKQKAFDSIRETMETQNTASPLLHQYPLKKHKHAIRESEFRDLTAESKRFTKVKFS